MPNPYSVKHEVKDAAAQERTHPVFDPLLEQFEVFIQKIQRLRKRKIIVKLPDKERVYRLRVPKVPHSHFNSVQMEEIKKALTKAAGKPCATIEQEIVNRANLHGVPLYIQQPNSGQFAGEEVWQ